MAFIEFDEVSKHYPGAAAPAVDRLRLSIEQGEFLTLLGPSGSGKTTTLMMLAGFEPVSSGTIRLQGQPIEQLPAHRRSGVRAPALAQLRHDAREHALGQQPVGDADELRHAAVHAAHARERVAQAVVEQALHGCEQDAHVPLSPAGPAVTGRASDRSGLGLESVPPRTGRGRGSP